MLRKLEIREAIHRFSWLILSHWFLILLFILHYFVVNGFLAEEQNKLSVIKDDYALITSETDKRKGNVFHSTSDYFLRVSEMVPEVDAFLQSAPIEISFSYLVQGETHTVRLELPLYMIGSGYFDAFNGRFIQGRGFTRNEVFSGRPVVIMTEGALNKIFGDYDRAPSMIWINGSEYQVIGTWAFEAKDVIENEAIFLPLGLSQVFSMQSNTYINNYIMKGRDSEGFLKLKKAIDKIQLDAGYTPVRPEYTFTRPAVSKKSEYILVHNKAYLDVFIWLSFILYVGFFFREGKAWMSFSQRWAVWTFMLKGHSREHAREASEYFYFIQALSVVGAGIGAFVILVFLHYFMKLPLHLGSEIHPGIFLYLLFTPIQLWLLQEWSKKMVYSFK